MFDLKRPCKQCPFRTDRPGFIRPERAREIIDGITKGDQSFVCHKTLDLPDAEQQHCAGATIFLEANGRANQMMRICERIGAYDRKALDMDSPVFKTRRAMIDHMKKRA